jgi:hypothetical protein
MSCASQVGTAHQVGQFRYTSLRLEQWRTRQTPNTSGRQQRSLGNIGSGNSEKLPCTSSGLFLEAIVLNLLSLARDQSFVCG